jgi:hypothetical protein
MHLSSPSIPSIVPNGHADGILCPLFSHMVTYRVTAE